MIYLCKDCAPESLDLHKNSVEFVGSCECNSCPNNTPPFDKILVKSYYSSLEERYEGIEH